MGQKMSESSPSAMPAAVAKEPIEFVSPPRMAKELDCTVRSLNRKKPTDPDFPVLFDINGRKYSRRPDFEHYKRILVQRGLETARRGQCGLASLASGARTRVKLSPKNLNV
jgi:hypothetical protein